MVNLEIILTAIILSFAFLSFLYFFSKNTKSKENNSSDNKLEDAIKDISLGQQQLVGSLKAISDTHASTQTAIIKHVETRLEEVQKSISTSLNGTSVKTAQTLGELQERLQTIDKAQTNIEKLSGDVLSLQEILSNKQARGIFGEIQLIDIVKKALPSDAFDFQFTLSNGKRADCIIYLPEPQGNIIIDSK